MTLDVRAFCESLAQAFVTGDLASVSTHYAHPLAVYTPDGVRLEFSPEDTMNAIFTRRAWAIAAGMASIEVTVHEIGDSVDGRFPVRLDWTYRNAEAAEIGRSRIRYFCTLRPGGGIIIEMVEFLEIAFPNAEDPWPASALRH